MAAPATVSTRSEERVVLRDVSWETYERILADFLERSSPRFAYDRGVLEIRRPSPKHEQDNLALAQAASAVSEELEIDYLPVGSMTYRRPALQRGFEADSSFYILNERLARNQAEIDPAVDPPPDLVIEVDVSHPSLDKLPIYASLGVGEVWRCRDDRVTISVLEGDGCRESDISFVIPPLSNEILTRFLIESRSQRRLAWLQRVRSWAREQRRPNRGPA